VLLRRRGARLVVGVRAVIIITMMVMIVVDLGGGLGLLHVVADEFLVSFLPHLEEAPSANGGGCNRRAGGSSHQVEGAVRNILNIAPCRTGPLKVSQGVDAHQGNPRQATILQVMTGVSIANKLDLDELSHSVSGDLAEEVSNKIIFALEVGLAHLAKDVAKVGQVPIQGCKGDVLSRADGDGDVVVVGGEKSLVGILVLEASHHDLQLELLPRTRETPQTLKQSTFEVLRRLNVAGEEVHAAMVSLAHGGILVVLNIVQDGAAMGLAVEHREFRRLEASGVTTRADESGESSTMLREDFDKVAIHISTIALFPIRTHVVCHGDVAQVKLSLAGRRMM
jgi:hypothetical protein